MRRDGSVDVADGLSQRSRYRLEELQGDGADAHATGECARFLAQLRDEVGGCDREQAGCGGRNSTAVEQTITASEAGNGECD